MIFTRSTTTAAVTMHPMHPPLADNNGTDSIESCMNDAARKQPWEVSSKRKRKRVDDNEDCRPSKHPRCQIDLEDVLGIFALPINKRKRVEKEHFTRNMSEGKQQMVGIAKKAIHRELKAKVCPWPSTNERATFLANKNALRQELKAKVPPLEPYVFGIAKANDTVWNTDDKEAMKDYTGDGYIAMNKALRSGNVAEVMQVRIAAVKHAMSKTGALEVFQGNVFRGALLPPKITPTLKKLALYSDAAFLSTSEKRKVATATFGGSKFSTLFMIESKTGLDVSGYSDSPKEKEVLFLPGTTFEITDVVKKGDNPCAVVKMEEVVL